MKRCAGCGKRIWSSAISIPEKGDYHYECAEETGVLLGLDTDPSTISKIADEIQKETELLGKLRADGADRRESTEHLVRLRDKVEYLDTLMTVHIRQKQKRLREKEKG